MLKPLAQEIIAHSAALLPLKRPLDRSIVDFAQSYGWDAGDPEHQKLLAAMALQEFEAVDSDAQAKKNVVRAIESVAAKLGNTPSVCRKAYIHPAVCESYLAGTLLDLLTSAKPTPTDGLDEFECVVVEFLAQMTR